jgi:predicted phosphodiesterase/biotin operon repressor
MGSNLQQFRDEVAALTNKHPKWSARRIAEELEVPVPRVRRALGWLQSHKQEDVPKFNPADPMVRSDAVKLLQRNKKKGVSLEKLANYLHTTEKNAKDVISHLSHHDGYNIGSQSGSYFLSDVLPPMKPLNIKGLRGKEIKFGVVSDTHLCSHSERLDVLEAAYDTFKQQKITQVFHAGNMLDGEFKFNRYELYAHGVHDQCSYMADHYPQRSGIKTYFCTGECHEGWWQKDTGLRIGWYMQNWAEERGRNDLIHIGHLEQDVLFERPHGTFRLRIIHPGGGTPYALSYPSQKMVESFQGGEKPQAMIMGHFHKFDMTYPREVLTLLPGCVQDQTPFMRKKKLGAHVGFCICTIGARVDGTLGRFGVEWIPFYDVAYHRKFDGYELEV